MKKPYLKKSVNQLGLKTAEQKLVFVFSKGQKSLLNFKLDPNEPLNNKYDPALQSENVLPQKKEV